MEKPRTEGASEFQESARTISKFTFINYSSSELKVGGWHWLGVKELVLFLKGISSDSFPLRRGVDKDCKSFSHCGPPEGPFE